MAKRSTKSEAEPEVYINPLDPHNVTPRLQQWISELIEKRDNMSVREEIAAIAAIGRLQVMFVTLREEQGGGVATGTEVKRFAKAFAANADRGRKGAAGKSNGKLKPSALESTAAVAASQYDDELEL